MADYSGAPIGQVLTENPRGWNDPPSYVFAPATNVYRKRIDPRKRVGHDLTSASAIQPVPQPPALNGSVQPPGGITGSIPPTLNLQAAIPHSTSNPEIQVPVTNIISVPPMHHANSVPTSLNCYAQPKGDESVLNQQQQVPKSKEMPIKTLSPTSTENNSPNSSMTHPVNDKSTDGRKLSAPSNSLVNSAIFNQLSTPTMLQSSHLAKRNNTVEKKATQLNPSFRSLSPVSHTNPPPPISNLPTMSSLPPMSTANPHTQINAYPNNPSISQNISPANVITSAPPIDGFYAAKSVGGKLSPKTCTPQNSGQCSPAPIDEKLIIENDSELLNEIVDRLFDCRDKCSCVFTNKASEEINKKMITFKSMWSSNKLSVPVKQKMSTLSEALEKREFLQADAIHKSLIVNHSSEVVSWMVAVKKLISSYQKVVEDNNKY